jgi:acyl-CoA synthetase (NDP forming)
MTADVLARLLKPRSVALIGASADPSKLTGRPVAYLRRHGFDGAIWPVNPRAAEIGGLRCYPRVADLPGAPDAAIVLLGAEHAVGAVAELSAIGTAAAIVLAGGFGETGAAGAARQVALRDAAGTMRLLGPNTIGLVNLTDGVVLSATGALEVHDLPAGGISLVSQSGGILGSMLSRGAARGVGFARLVATGNEVDLDAADLLAHLAADSATRVIALYLEGLRRPGAFRDAARLAADAGKPVVAFKVGRSEAGARAAISHTGAMAGTERITDALFRACGVIRAERFSDLIDIPAALAAGRRARGRRIAVLTSTGGAGALLADAAGLAGLELPLLAPATAARIAAPLGADPRDMAANPVDVTLAGVKPEVFQEAIAALLDSPDHDALAVVVGSSALANPDLAADALAAASCAAERPLIAYVSPHAPAIVAALNLRGVPAFDQPDACSAVLSVLSAPPPRVAPPMPAPDPGPLPSGTLDEWESAALFARFGVPVAEARGAVTPAEAAKAALELAGADGRVVLKVRDRRIAHKTDLGGVRVGVPVAGVAAEAEALLIRVAAAAGFKPAGLLVQLMVPRGAELILGLRREGEFGTVLLLGFGGVAAELSDDTALRMLPLSRTDVREMLEGLRGARLLAGHRGATAADVEALLDAVLAFARMGEALGPRLVEAEINPLFAGPGGVLAADSLAVLTDA